MPDRFDISFDMNEIIIRFLEFHAGSNNNLNIKMFL